MMMSLPKLKITSLQPRHLTTTRSSPQPPHTFPTSSTTRTTPSHPLHCLSSKTTTTSKTIKPNLKETQQPLSLEHVVVSGVSVGLIMVLLMGMDVEKAMALGPEGPLMEEFWDNVRRYGLYALTVSTGALSAVFEPIFELLKNPISAVLILVILGGSFYIVSQVVSAMTGLNEFAYDYAY